MSALVGPPRRRRRRRRAARSLRAVWLSRDQRLVVLLWAYADCLAFLLVRNGACYACVFQRGGNAALATLQRFS